MTQQTRLLDLLRKGPVTPLMIFIAKRKRNGYPGFIVQCPHCGKRKWMQHQSAYRSKSCGCQTSRILHECFTKHGHAKNYGVESKTYRTWRRMMDACYNNNYKERYKNYGGRGIRVCERWHSFENFLADMGEKPAGLTIGRIDNDGNYEPSNCRWETAKEQANNRRTNRVIKIRGKKMTMTQAAEYIGISSALLRWRLENWPLHRALSEPRHAR